MGGECCLSAVCCLFVHFSFLPSGPVGLLLMCFVICSIPLRNIYGPPQQPLSSLSSLNTSTQDVWNIMSGACKEDLPPTAMPAFVDVRDVALAHVRATEREEAKGQRYLLIGGVYVSLFLNDS